MTLQELITELRLDFGDPGGTLLGDTNVSRAIKRAVTVINKDIRTSYVCDDVFVTPELIARDKELLLLRAHAFICSMMRSICAQNFSFTSGDKKVDKTKQADWWAEQESDLLIQYRERITEIKEETGDTLFNFKPLIFEVGSKTDERTDAD